MIKFILIPLSIILGCGATKTSQSSVKTDTMVIAEPADLNQRDSVIAPNEIQVPMPACMKNKIDSFKLKEAHEKPQRVVQYLYKGKQVYYVVMPCCDFFNEVYDARCNYLGAPDGGFTGTGDGKLPDFLKEAIKQNTIWEAAK